MKKYILNEIEYFSISDLCVFLEQNFGIDYQNHIIKVNLLLIKKAFIFTFIICIRINKLKGRIQN